MNRSNYPLRVAAASAMFLTLICYFAQGKHPSVILLVGQVLFGLSTFVLVILVLFSTVNTMKKGRDKAAEQEKE